MDPYNSNKKIFIEFDQVVAEIYLIKVLENFKTYITWQIRLNFWQNF